MTSREVYPIAALLTDEGVAGVAITELAQLGVTRHDILVGMRNERRLQTLAQRYETTPLDQAAHVSGMFSGLSQLIGSEKPADTDALIHRLVSAGIPLDRARYFDSELRDDRVLLVVPRNAPTAEALALLARHRADIGLVNAGGKDTIIELREERIELVKSVVKEGEVVFRTEVISEVRTFEVTVEREEFVIERHFVRPDGKFGGDVEITRIPLKHEEVAIVKSTVVTDEVRVRTDQVIETQTVSETVRHEVLHIEHSGDGVVHDTAGLL